MYTVAALLATAALASAAPSVLKARDGCATAYLENFTLAAWNTSMPNNNGTGAPLVLGYGSEFEGNEYFTLSTYASYPYNQFPTLAMSNGVLAATGSDNRPVATAPSAGTELHFITPLEGNPDHAFCAASSSDGDNFYELSVGGDTDGWWLCPAKDSEVNVVYKPDQNHGNGYDYDRCYPVKLHIVFDDVSGRGATMMGSSQM